MKTSVMGNKELLLSLSLITVLAIPALALTQDSNPTRDTSQLHHDAIVIDTHIDTPQRMLDEGFDMDHRDALGHIDLPRMREGGLDAGFMSIWVNMNTYEGPPATARALQLIDAVYEQARRHPDKIVVATTAADIRRAHSAGKTSLLMGLEGANPINDDLGLLRMFHRLGIRYLTLTHGKTSNWIDSATDKPKHNGLSPFGREVVREMNRLGIMVDVSHISVKAFYDVLETTTAPVIASHSSAQALTNIPRNMNDDQLRALAKNGGVVQVAFGSWFVKEGNDAARSSKKFKDWLEQQRAQTKEKCGDDPKCRSLEGLKRNAEIMKRVPRGTLQDIADHIDHVVKIAGIDHAGYGSDFDGVNSMPVGLDDVTFLPALTQELARRGYSDADILKILGGNTLRVMEAVERIAAELSN